jgi:hypothetical protein
MSRARNRPDPQSGLPRTITVTVPLRFERRGGRKTVISPALYSPPAPSHDNALIKALARAHRWRRMIEMGEYPSVTELAKAERINQSYACRLLRLTLLAPVIVEAILNGEQPQGLQLNHLLGPLPVEWKRQPWTVL